MTSIARESAYGALATLVGTLPGMGTVTRKLKHWSDVPAEECPAAFIEVAGESRVQQRGLDAKIELRANVWMYARTEGDPAGPIVNGLLDALDAALAPPNQVQNVQTLGGIVHHCWIEGETQIFEGNLDDEAVAIVPVVLLIT